MRIAWLVLSFLFIAGCGSSGSTGTSDPGHGLGPGTSTGTAKVTVSTQSSSGDTSLYAAEFTLHLPQGVTVAANAATGEVAEGVIGAADTRATAGGRYTPATAATQASVKVNVIDELGLTVGDLVTISCSVPAGSNPGNTAFTLDNFSAWGVRNNSVYPLSGITPRLSVQTQ